jgi:hypothetical protein
MKIALALFLLLTVATPVPARGAELMIAHRNSAGAVKLVLGSTMADIYVDARDARVANIAADLLSQDVERVTGRKPRVLNDPAKLRADAVIVGTIGSSTLIDMLIASNKVHVADIKGQWETYKLQVVDKPLPNVTRALVILGSDRRGTAYGVFALSEAIGVSPWYWWADVTPMHQDALVIQSAAIKDGPPSVKYRGIFINDEDWGLQPWAAKTFEPDFKNIGPKTYAKIFELMLRLKLNYIWPAMHNCTIEFGKIDANIRMADEWGIVAGASHPEGMNRNNVDWPKLKMGEWRFDTNSNNIIAFWEEWVRKRGPFEAVWTIGMRGVHDSPMLPANADIATKVRLLEAALDAQRDLLKKYVNPDIEKVAQVFCPYKEALEQYRAGLKVPEDVILCWTEDNYGYIRQLSDPTEQKRKGGSGVYYHISYLGSPYSYVWINTTPPALIWEEMTKAYAYGADKLWALNVGDIKPGEVGIQFWAKLGWNINSYKRENLPAFLIDWATAIFGKEKAASIAAILDQYYRLGFARKPESLHRNPAAFSAANYHEAEQRLAEYRKLMADADEMAAKLPEGRRDAYFELVSYPVRMAALTNEAFIGANLSRFYAGQQNALANTYAVRVEEAVAQIETETAYYNNKLAGGKWRNIMTARGVNADGGYGFRWPQGTKLAGWSEQPAVAPVSLPQPRQVNPSPTFVEKDGCVSIEAEHPTRNTARGGAQWQVIPGLGRSGDSIAVYPATIASVDSGLAAAQSPLVEYDFSTISTGRAKIITYSLPTRRINATRGLRYAIAVDGAQPQIVDFNVSTESDRRWAENVMRNAAIDVTTHSIGTAGNHTLKIWMVDPGVVMDKIVIDLGGVKESYLGPPETPADN